MPTQLIQLGVPTVLTQNVIYALPARKCFVSANAAIDMSIEISFTTSVVVTGPNAILGVSAGANAFIRSSGVGTIVIAKVDD